ncbi:anhydro-N-acetylmuramic acid kinase [Chitinophaga nivalis]|uniref:Anhydro-N-acetylmuramic acid kinase n=1 Tax=Chitinophaga nivalis TaxID=2991709 RepID=A0ABT3IWJ3_9BACT|nr:anhydro-N-acetylmuramic acid kinase [Chitinophaga nivalis]MCW3461952.1 anhydro-N-acetylmuramic acid kinase [Chitinophaga nivalis]MCW3488357.1 anhydro-N-acetylmuramic acid kinase [Chitinophaga nivalis]
MVYNVIGTMSGSSLDGLDIVFAELTEVRGKWTYAIKAAESLPYEPEWVDKLATATTLPAREYLLLHTAYGHYTGERILAFIANNQLEHKVHFIASHGHTTFHLPAGKMTAQLGDGAAITAVTGLPVITDLRAVDVALGGQGAPIVPIGEKYLLPDYQYWLNLGGIANISAQLPEQFAAFDICPANRVLNTLANALQKPYDEGGALAAGGVADEALLQQLNALPYYTQAWPKSLANDFGTDTILPMIAPLRISVQGKLRTYTEHIAIQIAQAVAALKARMPEGPVSMLITGGGAFNTFLVNRIQEQLAPLDITVTVPDEQTVNFKEALVMALIGALRWRQEENIMSSVTGASRDSINGALWISH